MSEQLFDFAHENGWHPRWIYPQRSFVCEYPFALGTDEGWIEIFVEQHRQRLRVATRLADYGSQPREWVEQLTAQIPDLQLREDPVEDIAIAYFQQPTGEPSEMSDQIIRFADRLVPLVKAVSPAFLQITNPLPMRSIRDVLTAVEQSIIELSTSVEERLFVIELARASVPVTDALSNVIEQVGGQVLNLYRDLAEYPLAQRRRRAFERARCVLVEYTEAHHPRLRETMQLASQTGTPVVLFGSDASLLPDDRMVGQLNIVPLHHRDGASGADLATTLLDVIDQPEVYLARLAKTLQGFRQALTTFTDSVQSNRSTLLRTLRQYWIENYLNQLLPDETTDERLGQRLRLRPNAVLRHHYHGTFPLNDPTTRLVDVFQHDAYGEMLILGEPGAGKTVLLLELTRDLLASAENDPTQPLPLVFNLMSFNERFGGFAPWLRHELHVRYRVPLSIAETILFDSPVVLLLDGLDEIADDVRMLCVRQINDFRRERWQRAGRAPQFVVTSRVQEYEALSEQLDLNVAILIEALEDEQIAAYLSKQPTLQALLTEEAALREVVRFPFFLRAFRYAFADRSVAEIQAAQRASHLPWRDFLVDAYVHRALDEIDQQSSYTHDELRRYFNWLATTMQQQAERVFQLKLLQPTLLSDARAYRAYVWVSAAMIGLATATVFYGLRATGVVFDFGPTISYSVGFVLALSLWTIVALLYRALPPRIFFVLYGVFFGATLGFQKDLTAIVVLGFQDPFYANFMDTLVQSVLFFGIYLTAYNRSGIAVQRDRIVIERRMWGLENAYIGFIVAYLIGFWHHWFIFAERATILGWVFIPLAWGFVGLFCYGLTAPLSRVQSNEPNENPRDFFWYYLRLGMLIGLMAGFAFSLSNLVYRALPGDLGGWQATVVDFFWGTTFSLVVLVFGGLDLLKHYALRWVLYRQGKTPRNLPHFLQQDTHNRLIHSVGNGIIFTHRTIMDYFSNRTKTDSTGDPEAKQ